MKSSSRSSRSKVTLPQLCNWWWLKLACVVLSFGIIIELLTRPVNKPSPTVFSNANDVAVLTHAKQNGAHFAYSIGRRCRDCVRGIYANRDIKAGEIVSSLPLSYGIQLAERRHIPHVAELAYYFLLQVHLSPDFNNSRPHFWDSMPTPDELLHSATMSTEQLAMLHMPSLETELGWEQQVNEAVFNGSSTVGDGVRLLPLGSLLIDNDAVSLSTFQHVVGLIDSREFGFAGRRYLFPSMDMANLAIGHDNLGLTDYNDTHIRQFAIRNIKRGSELMWNYGPQTLHRPDVSMRTYGYGQYMDPPLMCARDLPDYNRLSKQFPHTDDGYYGPDGKFNTQLEHSRLDTLLKQLPTTEEEDAVLLEDHALPWKSRTLIEFRLNRKRALKRAMHLIATELGLAANPVPPGEA